MTCAACKDFNCGISVLKHCSGLQNKLYDYTLLGIPIISSFDSARGIGFEKGKHYIQADNSDQIILGIKRLIADTELAHNLNLNCLKYLKQNFEKEANIKKLRSILN